MGLSLLAGGPALAADLEALAARVKPAVVHITVYDAAGQKIGSGTGFFITEDGWIVTSDHVIERASEVRAALLDGSVRQVTGSLARDYDRDVAIIEVEGRGYPALTLADGGRVSDGTDVAVVGSPLGLSWTLSSGIVSNYRTAGLPEHMRASKTRRSGPLLQITAAFSPGSSGSPVLAAETGEVIGVAASIVKGGSDLNFAVPVDAVQDLLLAIGPDTEVQSFSALPLRNLIISAVFFALLAAGYVAFRVRARRGKQRGS